VAFHLTVAGSLEPLADALAAELAVPPADPFTPDVVVVPGAGVRAWLNARLAHRLGATPRGADGVVANIDYAFPAQLVTRALGEATGLGAWSVGPLTWAIHEILLDRAEEFGQPRDAVRARTIADSFDRYALYRQAMVLRWSAGDDVNAVGEPLDEHQRWQPALWRAVQAHIGGPTDAERMAALTASLAAGELPEGMATDVPERVIVFGLATLPPPHLEVLTALSAHREVHVLAPVASATRWQQVCDGLSLPLRLPLLRSDPLVPAGVGHPLVTGWGRTSREAHVLLLAVADRAGDSSIEPPAATPALGPDATVLARLQHGLRADAAPPGAPIATDPPLPDLRALLDPADPSIRWHRAYGPARQVEVLRDALLHLLEERNADGTPRFEPRDIAVLCPDVGRFAPLIEATFAGDPAHGVPEVPVRVADRTLRQDNPILDAAGGLLDLLDGRCRASAVLAFAARAPVRLRFGLDTDAIGRIGEWVEATNVRWGLGPSDHARFGIPPEVAAHTWRAGLDQLLVGATMAPAGPRLGPGGVAPFPDIEGDDVAIAGALAELIHHLDRALTALCNPSPVDEWAAALSEALPALCEVPDADAWQWRAVERVIDEFRSEALCDGEARATLVEPADLATLLRGRLTGGAGRPRFGTGAVTVSSLVAQRGVPHPVVCLLGLDDDIGAGGLPIADDLVAAAPCIGDRDARGEQRAQLLDAVLVAGERLLVFSTGRDVRTNAEVPPVVALAELFDTIDAIVRPVDDGTDPQPPARRSLIVDHPRQAWSEPSFRPRALGVDGSWSYDAGALDAARARRAQVEAPPFLADPLPAPVGDADGLALTDLLAAVANPIQVFLRDRLGISIPSSDEAPDDEIPLALRGLEAWKLADALLEMQLGSDEGDPGRVEAWEQFERRRGAVPPLAFADDALADACDLVDQLEQGLALELRGVPHEPEAVPVEITIVEPDGADTTISGVVPGVCGDLVVRVTASRLKSKDLLSAWVCLAALTRHDPNRAWETLTIGRHPHNAKAVVQRLRLRSPAAATEVLAVVADLRRRALCDTVPAFPETTRALWQGDLGAARSAWTRRMGEATDRWVSQVFGSDFDALLDLPVRSDETIAGAPSPSRLAYWANRLWRSMDDTAIVDEREPSVVAAPVVETGT